MSPTENNGRATSRKKTLISLGLILLVLAGLVAFVVWHRRSKIASTNRNKVESRPEDFVDTNRVCSTPEVSADKARYIPKRRKQNGTHGKNLAESKLIKVYFHIITSETGDDGKLTDSQIDKQIEILNQKFAAALFTFELIRAKPAANDEWFKMEKKLSAEADAMEKLGVHEKHVLNIYTAELASTRGWAVYPWHFSGSPFYRDGVVVRYSTLPYGSDTQFNLGMRLVHEVAHWLGLVHTFENNCSEPGDYVDDTPAEYSAAGNCDDRYRDSCPDPSPDPVTNPMDVAIDKCVGGFTEKQIERMHAKFAQCRQSAQGCSEL